MRTILTTALLLSAVAHAQLPDTLDPQALELLDTVEFQADPRTLVSPIGVRMTINDKPALSREALEEAFDESYFARVPAGQTIRVSQNTEGRDVWDMPAGTQTFHRINLRKEGSPVFEIRSALKLSDGTWDLGIYAQEASSHTPVLRKQRYGGMPALALEYTSTKTGRELKIQMNRVPLTNCKMCHFNNSPSRYQFTTPEDAGPCGFGPAHPTLARDWATEYEKRVGHSPLSK
jgi:hypothetical protein